MNCIVFWQVKENKIHASSSAHAALIVVYLIATILKK